MYRLRHAPQPDPFVWFLASFVFSPLRISYRQPKAFVATFIFKLFIDIDHHLRYKLLVERHRWFQISGTGTCLFILWQNIDLCLATAHDANWCIDCHGQSIVMIGMGSRLGHGACHTTVLNICDELSPSHVNIIDGRRIKMFKLCLDS